MKLLSKQAIKPTVLIGTSGVGQTFTQEVVEAMATNNEVPFLFLLFALSLIKTSINVIVLMLVLAFTDTVDSGSLKPYFSS